MCVFDNCICTILGTHLSIKVRQKASRGCVNVVSIRFYELLVVNNAKRIIDFIKTLPLDTQTTIMLSASPQVLAEKPYWKQFVLCRG